MKTSKVEELKSSYYLAKNDFDYQVGYLKKRSDIKTPIDESVLLKELIVFQKLYNKMLEAKKSYKREIYKL